VRGRIDGRTRAETLRVTFTGHTHTVTTRTTKGAHWTTKYRGNRRPNPRKSTIEPICTGFPLCEHLHKPHTTLPPLPRADRTKTGPTTATHISRPPLSTLARSLATCPGRHTITLTHQKKDEIPSKMCQLGAAHTWCI
jgi:hypothetical protein